MNILIGLTAGMSVILAFFMGFQCGMKAAGGQTKPSCPGCSELVPGAFERVPVPADGESARKAAEDQKAFTDCMNYSAVQAYERKKP